MKKTFIITFLLLLSPFLLGQDYIVLFRPRAAGGGPTACTSPDNFITSAAHLYMHVDTDWPTNTAPQDEAGTTDLTFNTGVNETDLVSCSSGCAVGTPSTVYRLPLTGTDYAGRASVNLFKSTQYGDSTTCGWVKITSTDFDGIWGVREASTSNRMVLSVDLDGVASDGLVRYTAVPGGNLDTADGLVTASTWALLCQVLDANGGAGGTQNRSIYVNGVSAAGPTDVDDEVSTTVNHSGLRDEVPNSGAAADHEFEVYQFAVWHSVLTADQINELCCCGMNGEANPSDRDSLCGGTACTAY